MRSLDNWIVGLVCVGCGAGANGSDLDDFRPPDPFVVAVDGGGADETEPDGDKLDTERTGFTLGSQRPDGLDDGELDSTDTSEDSTDGEPSKPPLPNRRETYVYELCLPGSTGSCFGSENCPGSRVCSEYGDAWSECACPEPEPEEPEETDTDTTAEPPPPKGPAEIDWDSLSIDPVYDCYQGTYACTCINGETCIQNGVDCDNDGFCVDHYYDAETNMEYPRAQPPGTIGGACLTDLDCQSDFLCIAGVCGNCDPDDSWAYGICECESTGEYPLITRNTRVCETVFWGRTQWVCEPEDETEVYCRAK